MASDLKPYHYGPFQYGVNRNCDPIYGSVEGQMAKGQLYDARNVRMPQGKVVKRPGFAPMGAALTGIIQVLYDYYNVSNVQNTLAIGTTGAWTWSDSSQVWTQRATLHGTQYVIPSYTVFNGNFLMVNQNTTDGLQVYTGSGSFAQVTGSGAPSAAAGVMGYEDHVLLIQPVLSGTLYPYRIMWGDFNSYTQYASGDASFVDLLDVSDRLIGLTAIGPYAALFRQNTVMNIQPAAAPAFYAFYQQEERAGLFVPASVQQVTAGIPYLAVDDLYQYTGSASVPFANGSLRPVLAQGNENPAALQGAVSTIDPDMGEYWIAFPSSAASTQNDLLAVVGYQGNVPGGPGYTSFFDLKATALGYRALGVGLQWNNMTNWNLYTGQRWNAGQGIARFPLQIYADNAQVYQQQGTLDDNGAAIPASITTGLTDFGEPGDKEVQRWLVLMDSEPATSDAIVSLMVFTSNTGDISTARAWGPYFGEINTPGEVWIDADDVPPAIYWGVQATQNIVDEDFGLRDIVAWQRPRRAQ